MLEKNGQRIGQYITLVEALEHLHSDLSGSTPHSSEVGHYDYEEPSGTQTEGEEQSSLSPVSKHKYKGLGFFTPQRKRSNPIHVTPQKES